MYFATILQSLTIRGEGIYFIALSVVQILIKDKPHRSIMLIFLLSFTLTMSNQLQVKFKLSSHVFVFTRCCFTWLLNEKLQPINHDVFSLKSCVSLKSGNIGRIDISVVQDTVYTCAGRG